MSIAQRFKNERLTAGYTQEALAHKLGVGSTYISQIETGREQPGVELLVAMADLLSIDADELLLASGRVPQRFVTAWTKEPQRAARFLNKWKDGSNG